MVPPVQPLRVVGQREEIFANGEGRTGLNRQAARQKHVIGQSATSLAVSLNNWWMGGTEADNTTSYTIEAMSIESPAGLVTPILFGGGRSIFVAAGAIDVQSDELILPVTRGEEYWIKSIISVQNTGDRVPWAQTNATDLVGGQAWWYLDGATVLSSIDAPGAFTVVSGAAVDTRTNGFRPILLGRPVSDGPSFITVGDSISMGIGDQTASVYGRGFINRAMGGATPYPNLSFGRSGNSIGAYISGTRWKNYMQYARHAINELLTNNVNTGNSATLQANDITLSGQLRTGGAEKIIRTGLLVRTSSTDNYATAANQTPNAGWQDGNTVSILNAWWPSKVTDGTIDYFVPLAQIIREDSGANIDKWKTPKLYNNDDVHPNNAGSIVLAAEFRPTLEDVGLL